MGFAPVGLPLVLVAVAQKERFEALFGPAQIVDRVGARSGQIADGFVEFVRDVDRPEFARSVQPGELFGVSAVGLLPRTFFRRGLGRGDHDRVEAAFQKLAVDHKAGRPGLVHEVEADVFAP